MSQKNKKDIVCLCNNIERKTIEDAIRNGADTLNKIFDRTTAGVGPCGGSCRKQLGPLLDTYLTTGTFPVPQKKKKQRA
jgi:bacterioferritin-associated ferredoxin